MANEAIRPATKTLLLHCVISVYVIVKMALQSIALQQEEICYHCVSIIKEDIH